MKIMSFKYNGWLREGVWALEELTDEEIMINLRLPIFEGKSTLIFQFPYQHNSSMGPHEILEKFE